MDITKEKSNIFGQIAALRVSAEGYPKTALTNSLPSINKKTNSLDLLIDLLKSLVGFESLKDSVVTILAHNLDEIELEIKKSIKNNLKSMVSCSINPSLPQEFIDNGINIELNKIDYLDMFKISPNSKAGRLLYNDISTQSNSTDFNTFLYHTIQDNGGVNSWGQSILNHGILNIKFDAQSTNQYTSNNTLNIRPNSYYTNNNKKLPDLNNDYIDSISLFNTPKLINNVIEIIFGTLSLEVNKDVKQLENEIKLEEIINRIINVDEDIIIDDSYFSFTNEELSDIESKSGERRKGVKKVITCDNIETTINIDKLTSLNNELNNLINQTSTPQINELITEVVRKGIDDLANESTKNVGDNDKLNVKINFIENILKQLMIAIVNALLSPKVIIIFAINHIIVHGESFNDTEDFIKKNKSLITAVLQTVRDSIVSILMDRVLKEVKILVSDNIIKTQIERVKYKKGQVASLLGTSTETLRLISGLKK